MGNFLEVENWYRPLYTMEIHVKRLKAMLKRDVCVCCPAAKHYNPKSQPGKLWSFDSVPCQVCGDFVGIDKAEPFGISRRCPCYYFGREDAIKRTLIAVENYEKEVSDGRKRKKRNAVS